eukprot:5735861-Lingulodinium_polyedra.AAC.1
MAEVVLEKAFAERVRAVWRPDIDQNVVLVVLGQLPAGVFARGRDGRRAATIEESAAPWWEAFLPIPGGQPPQNAEEARGSPLFASLRAVFDINAGRIQKVTNAIATMTTVLGNFDVSATSPPLAGEAAGETELKVFACLGKGRRCLEGARVIEALRGDCGPPVRSPMEVKG